MKNPNNLVFFVCLEGKQTMKFNQFDEKGGKQQRQKKKVVELTPHTVTSKKCILKKIKVY